MVLFAEHFGLRVQDYTKSSTSPYPTVTSLSLNYRKRTINFTIEISKGKYVIPEKLHYQCQSNNDGCIYCILKQYRDNAKKRGIKSKAFFTKKHSRGYNAFTSKRFYDIFKERAAIVFGDKYNPAVHRAHGIRHGRATGLIKNGTPTEVARRVLRHAPGSLTISRYIHLTPQELAKQILSYDK